MFSKACEYALKTMIYLAADPQKEKRVGLREIAGAIDSPEAFTAKILQQLVRAGLLRSVRGPNGGFQLRQNAAITLAEVVSAIDGDSLLKSCVLGLERCSERHPCPVHDKFKAVRDHLAGVLGSTHIDDLASGNSYLKL